MTVEEILQNCRKEIEGLLKENYDVKEQEWFILTQSAKILLGEAEGKL